MKTAFAIWMLPITFVGLFVLLIIYSFALFFDWVAKQDIFTV